MLFIDVTKFQICDRIARERRVETMVENIARRHLDDDLRDLVQIVYLIILEYDEDKIVELWDLGQINYFIVRVIKNQYFYKRTEYDRCAHFWDRADKLEEER